MISKSEYEDNIIRRVEVLEEEIAALEDEVSETESKIDKIREEIYAIQDLSYEQAVYAANEDWHKEQRGSN